MSIPIPVVCEPSPDCCQVPASPFYGQGVTFLSAQTGFILNCPPGFSCDAGFYPTTIVVPRGRIPFTPPTGVNPLRFTCCDGSIEVRYLPDGFTQAEFYAAAQSIADAAAVKLAGCIADDYNRQHARRPARCIITSTSPLPEGDVGEPYSVVLAQTGATLPVTWSLLSGALPDGLSLSSGGVISGTPTVAASFGFVVRLSNLTGTSCTKQLSITINGCDGEDWCAGPVTCRLRIKDFNQADWTYVWDGNLDEFTAAIPPAIPCVSYHDGFDAGLQYSVGLAKWRFNILCPDLSVYLANGPAGPQGTSPIGTYTFDVSSDPACVGPASFDIEAYTP